jgi:hypothetical protein
MQVYVGSDWLRYKFSHANHPKTNHVRQSVNIGAAVGKNLDAAIGRKSGVVQFESHGTTTEQKVNTSIVKASGTVQQQKAGATQPGKIIPVQNDVTDTGSDIRRSVTFYFTNVTDMVPYSG